MVLFTKPMYPEQQCQYVKLATSDMEKSAKVLTKYQAPQNDNQIQKSCQLVECLLIHLSFCQGLHMLVEKESIFVLLVPFR